jgi:organic hydroperoxide reductase OsmC/OhrA
MLTFLALCARKRFTVDTYFDEATGVLERNATGKFWVARVSLRPRVAFSGARQPSTGELSDLHRTAHETCFVANSVKSEVTVDWQ